MSQPTRVKRTPPPPRQNPLPAIISAVVVIAVFVGLGFLLANNRSNSSPTAAVPTMPAFQEQATGAAIAAAPTAAIAGASDASGKPSDANKYTAPPPMTIDAKKNYVATITTPRGNIVVKLRPISRRKRSTALCFLPISIFTMG